MDGIIIIILILNFDPTRHRASTVVSVVRALDLELRVFF